MDKETCLKPFVGYPYSYAFGRSQKSLKYETLSQVLDETVKKLSNELAIISIHERVSMSFEELQKNVNKLAKLLIERFFIIKGDVIAIMTANTYKFIVLQYACAKIGAILCPINAYYKQNELEFSLLKINPKIFFIPGCESGQEKSVNQIYTLFNSIISTIPKSLSHLVLLDGTIKERLINHIKVSHYDEMMKEPEIEPKKLPSDINNNEEKALNYSINSLDADKTCALFFTSGTTGPPKAAKLSHFNLTNNTRFFGTKLGFSIGKPIKVCLPVPIFHVFGSVLGTITMATCGITLVFPGYRYDIESTVKAIIKEECNFFMGVPAMLIDIINYVEDHQMKITSLLGIVTAATNVPYEVVQKFCQTVPSIKKVYIVYGATETSPIITTPMPGDPLMSTLDNVGIPLDFCEVKIVDKKSGDVVKIGEKGELLTRGPQVFLGYWCDDIQTNKAIDDGNWYRTGDLATMDARGYIRIVGRTKEIIIRGGINIYPKEIEEVLISHPYIADAAVCGIPHPRLGEEICAWIKFRDPSKKLTEDDIRCYCKDKMAYFKVPRWILFVTEFPTTASGKVQKYRMKEISCKTFTPTKIC